MRHTTAALVATATALLAAPAAHGYVVNVNNADLTATIGSGDNLVVTGSPQVCGVKGLILDPSPSAFNINSGNIQCSAVNSPGAGWLGFTDGALNTISFVDQSSGGSSVQLTNRGPDGNAIMSLTTIDSRLGAGNDTLIVNTVAPMLTIAESNDFPSGDDFYDLTNLTGLTGCTIGLGSGADILRLALVPCAVDGGPDYDRVEFPGAPGGVNVQYTGPATAALGHGGSVTAVEELWGGPGPDTFTGAAGTQVFHGLANSDTISGGPDFDQMFGGDGDDQLESRDGVAERIDCGNGNDVAIVEAIDELVGCETVLLPRPRPCLRHRPPPAARDPGARSPRAAARPREARPARARPPPAARGHGRVRWGASARPSRPTS